MCYYCCWLADVGIKHLLSFIGDSVLISSHCLFIGTGLANAAGALPTAPAEAPASTGAAVAAAAEAARHEVARVSTYLVCPVLLRKTGAADGLGDSEAELTQRPAAGTTPTHSNSSNSSSPSL